MMLTINAPIRIARASVLSGGVVPANKCGYRVEREEIINILVKGRVSLSKYGMSDRKTIRHIYSGIVIMAKFPSNQSKLVRRRAKFNIVDQNQKK